MLVSWAKMAKGKKNEPISHDQLPLKMKKTMLACARIGLKMGPGTGGYRGNYLGNPVVFPRYLHASLSLWDDKDKKKSGDECEPEPQEVCKTDAELVKKKDEAEDECEEKKSDGGGKKLESKGRKGVIHAVIGPVIDVYFEEEVPEVLNALQVQDAPIANLVLEVSQRINQF